MAYRYSDEFLTQLVAESRSIKEILEKLELPTSGNCHVHLSNRVRELKLDTSHFCRRYSAESIRKQRVWQNILFRNDRKVHSCYLRKSMIEYGFVYECCLCKQGVFWQGKDLVLHVDHMDGNNKNNYPDNLRFLCPNCHSQTDNFGAKNMKPGRRSSLVPPAPQKPRPSRAKAKNSPPKPRKPRPKRNDSGTRKPSFWKVEHPTREQLAELLWLKPTTAIAKDFGVSDKAVGKWAKQYGLSKPPRGYWQKQAAAQIEKISCSRS